MNLFGLENYKQFIAWGLGKGTKVPLDYRTGEMCDPHDPDNWGTAEEVLSTGRKLGFVITHEDPLFFIDIDNGLDDSGVWKKQCVEVVQRFPGALVTVSNSGRGLHIIGTGRVEGDRRVKSFADDDSFDMLATGKRFIALSFTNAVGHVSTVLHEELKQFVSDKLTATEVIGSIKGWTTESAPGYEKHTDAKVIRLACKKRTASGAFGGSCTFKDIWELNTEVLHKFYPDDHDRPFDASRVDSACAQHLAFWTAGNCEQIERIMRGSRLFREKWSIRDTYLSDTILNAVLRQTNFFGKIPQVNKDESRGVVRSGLQYLTPEAQLKHFKDCVYITSEHRILVPSGAMLKPEQFKALYGGYLFALDNIGDKTSRNAFEVFTESQAVHHPKVDGLVFRPDLPFLYIEDNYINIYKPHIAPRMQGDASPFLRHLEKLLPDEGDRDILLSYMAACVQRPGVKFQWCPVIQGVQGNGKTVIYTIMEQVIGENYCHQQDPTDLQNVFNAWVEGKLLVAIEEIHIGGKTDIINRLKPLITNNRVPIQKKGVDQRTGSNMANFILFSNHKDAISKTEDDRRYCVLYTAQQSIVDLKKQGMDSAYFKELYAWIKGDGGPIMTEYLHNYKINVEVQGRAPDTTSTVEALRVGFSYEEIMVLEGVENNVFSDKSVLLSTHVLEYLRYSNCMVSGRALSPLLGRVGYDQRLFGDGGRTMINGERTRIFVKRDSLLSSESEKMIKSLASKVTLHL